MSTTMDTWDGWEPRGPEAYYNESLEMFLSTRSIYNVNRKKKVWYVSIPGRDIYSVSTAETDIKRAKRAALERLLFALQDEISMVQDLLERSHLGEAT